MVENRLKIVREEAGLTQEQLAQAIGSNKAYISTLENGKRDITNIRQSTMTQLCKALNCKPQDILLDKFDFSQNGRLIVDGIYYVEGMNCTVYLIDGVLYRERRDGRINVKQTGIGLAKRLGRVDRPIDLPSQYCMTNSLDHYFFNPVAPRDPNLFYKKELRPITKEELEELKTELRADSTDVFQDTVLEFLGPEYSRTYSYVQIKTNMKDGVAVENMLREKGIEASNRSVGRVNIRVE